MVDMIRAITPGQPLLDSVFQALFHVDARALALVFKDLSKAMLGHRATEIFDWLRRLDNVSEFVLLSLSKMTSNCRAHESDSGVYARHA